MYQIQAKTNGLASSGGDICILISATQSTLRPLFGYCISATGRMITFTMRLRGRGMAASTTASATSSAVEKPGWYRVRCDKLIQFGTANCSYLAWQHCQHCAHHQWQSGSRLRRGKQPHTCIAIDMRSGQMLSNTLTAWHAN